MFVCVFPIPCLLILAMFAGSSKLGAVVGTNLATSDFSLVKSDRGQQATISCLSLTVQEDDLRDRQAHHQETEH